jgi:hypothetical protein
MSTEFEDKDLCREQLQNLLNLSPENEQDSRILDALVESCEVIDPSQAQKRRFELRVGKWVIREEDLKLFDVVKDSLAMFASGGYLLGNLTAAGITSFIVSLVRIGRDCYLNGVTITDNQLQIILTLKKEDRATPFKDILALLLSETPSKWNDVELRKELEALKTMPSRNKKVEIVQSTSADEWFLTGI